MSSWNSEEREFSINGSTITKRQLQSSELKFDPNNILFPKERLTNEHAALRYVRDNTTIPIPSVVRFGIEQGSLTLVTEYIDGVLLEDIQDEKREVAIKAVDEQMEHHIFPELRKLCRSSIGSVEEDLPVYPPNVVMYHDMKESWQRITSKHADFVFCHNDLSGHNIIIDADTYEIKGIIDWEYSGFYPDWFERKLWRERFNDRDEQETEAYVKKVEDFFNNGRLT